MGRQRMITVAHRHPSWRRVGETPGAVTDRFYGAIGVAQVRKNKAAVTSRSQLWATYLSLHLEQRPPSSRGVHRSLLKPCLAARSRFLIDPAPRQRREPAGLSARSRATSAEAVRGPKPDRRA